MLRQLGFDATGLEMNAWVVNFAKKTFHVPVLLGPVEEQQLERSSLDIVILMDVLEHLPDPERTIRHCLPLLKPNGIFVIQTPYLPEGKTYEDLVQQGDPFLKMLIEDEHLIFSAVPPYASSSIASMLTILNLNRPFFLTMICF